MKKDVFFTLFVLVALAFVACDTKNPADDPVNGGENPTPTEKAVINITTDSLELGIGDTQKLQATVTPVGTQLKINWTSDNAGVVVVDAAGIIVAIAPGTANVIASAEGATSDTCVVVVTRDALFDQFALGGFGIFGKGEVLVADTLVQATDGTIYRCEIANGLLIAWDENIVFVNGVGFTGSGFGVWQEVPMLWITEGEDAGAYLGGKYGFMVATPELEEGVEVDFVPYFMAPGSLVDKQKYGDGWLGMLTAQTEAEYASALNVYLEAHTGTQLLEVENGEFYYTAAGNVAYAQFDNVYNEATEKFDFVYDLVVDWYDVVNDDRFYGLAITLEEDENGELVWTGFVEPYDVRQIRKEYTNKQIDDVEPAQAPMWRPTKKNVYLNQAPTIGVKKMDMMYKK